MEQETPQRKDGAPYRPLTIPERDMLFALYDKHSGNIMAITRDTESIFKSYNQLHYYCRFYHFQDRLAHIRAKRATEIVKQLSDFKIDAIQRAAQMIKPRQLPLKMKDPATGLEIVMKDTDGQPIFYEQYPTDKEIKTAWEIIKTELGEPTNISKSEVNNPQADEVSKALDVIQQLANGKPSDNADTLQSERGAAGDTAEVSPAVQNDIHKESPED